MTARALSSNFFVILLALLVVCCHCSTHILFLDWFVNRFGHFAGHVGCFRFWLIATAGKTWLPVHLPAWQWRSYIPCKSSHDYCSFSWALLHAVVVVMMMMMMIDDDAKTQFTPILARPPFKSRGSRTVFAQYAETIHTTRE